ncbi:hypothetical protein CICLE_v10016899mg [Citrus x clementina]|uniref:Uncharacterized protein n=1 Tax=Citrus clementina TaxID=85681 RepID=V4UGF7_CITCL|nr:hypothetical protein CICLE_v10016899mg [Citrus x clementina]
MLKQQLGVTWTVLSSPAMLPAFLNSKSTCICSANSTVKFTNIDKSLQLIRNYRRVMLMRNFRCRVRRRVRYEDDEEDEEEYGHNEEIVALESYSLSARGEALLVRAVLDDRDFEVLVFKCCLLRLKNNRQSDCEIEAEFNLNNSTRHTRKLKPGN